MIGIGVALLFNLIISSVIYFAEGSIEGAVSFFFATFILEVLFSVVGVVSYAISVHSVSSIDKELLEKDISFEIMPTYGHIGVMSNYFVNLF